VLLAISFYISLLRFWFDVAHEVAARAVQSLTHLWPATAWLPAHSSQLLAAPSSELPVRNSSELICWLFSN